MNYSVTASLIIPHRDIYGSTIRGSDVLCSVKSVKMKLRLCVIGCLSLTILISMYSLTFYGSPGIDPDLLLEGSTHTGQLKHEIFV